jgi:hypothetical protein
MKTVVDHFGLHFLDSGVGLLAQEGPVQTALPINLNIEMVVKKPKRTLRCPHNIDLSDVSDQSLRSDPLVDVMMPVPKPVGSSAVYMEDNPENLDMVRRLMQLSSPGTTSSIVPLWMYKVPTIHEFMRLTNLQPLVITGFMPVHHARLRRIVDMSTYLPRRLIVLLPPIWLQAMSEQLTTSLSPMDLEGLPLERIGAARLRQFMLSKGVPA